jgi:hypothetical protein
MLTQAKPLQRQNLVLNVTAINPHVSEYRGLCRNVPQVGSEKVVNPND